MKKLFALLLALAALCMLSSCFPFGSAADHPDMVEYTEDEVLEVAKEK